MVCTTARQTSFAKMHQKCHACATRNRIIDSPHGNVYVFCELLICCLTQVVGYRTEDDYSTLYEHATAHYAFNPDEVNAHLFKSLPDSE